MPAEARVAPVAAPSVVAPAGADVSIHIEGVVHDASGADDPRAAARFRVRLATGAPSELRVLSIEGEAARIRVVEARDAGGAIEASVTADRDGATLRFARDPSPPVEVVYEVTATAARVSTVPVLAVDETHARVPFEWLALPRVLDARPVTLDLELGQVAGQKVAAASTLAPGPSFRGVRPLGTLRRGYALLGEVGTARLDAYEGHDHAAWLGFTSFDARWVAAETAGVRSMLDRWIGARAGRAHALLLVSEKRPDVPFAMVPRDDGLWISADLSAPWDAAARLGVAQHLAQRYFGGAISIVDGRGAPSALGWFWSEGVARVAGREALFDLGLIGFDDVAGELDRALADVVLSPVGREGVDRLVAAAAGQGEEASEARRVLAARGVLWASGLDARRRVATTGPRSLGEVMRELFKRAATERRATLSLEELARAVGDAAGDEKERALLLAFASGPADGGLSDRAAGTCHARETRPLARFQLGASWDVAPPSPDPDAPLGVVREVKPGSPAARAGLRVGDTLVSASYAKGRPDVEAKLVVRREGKDVRIAFRPRGPEVRGPAFARRRGARDETCVR